MLIQIFSAGQSRWGILIKISLFKLLPDLSILFFLIGFFKIIFCKVIVIGNGGLFLGWGSAPALFDWGGLWLDALF